MPCRLRVNEWEVQRQARNLVPHFCAKWAGFILVKRQLPALLVHSILRSLRTDQTFRPGDGFFEQHDRAKNNAQGSEEQTDKVFHYDVRMAIVFKG